MAPAGAEQSRAALAVLTGSAGTVLPNAGQSSDADAVVVADVGRVDPDAVTLGLLAAADAVLLVTRVQVAELAHLPPRLDALRRCTRRIGIVLAGGGAYPPGEVAEAFGVPVLGVLPADRHGAAAFGGQVTYRRSLSRLPLSQAATRLARRLATGPALDPAVEPTGPAIPAGVGS